MQGAVLTVTKPRRRRNRLVTVLLLPAVAFMWLIGWCMYCVGRAAEAKPKTQAKHRDGDVTLVPVVAVDEEPFEEEEAFQVAE